MYEDEVLFLTSRERIYEAFLRWLVHAGEPFPSRIELAATQSRTLMRYLVVPEKTSIPLPRTERLYTE